MPILTTVGHVPLEISKFCYHGGDIEGKVIDIRPRRSPIPSGGLEIKLLLTFCGPGPVVDKMKQIVRGLYLGVHRRDHSRR